MKEKTHVSDKELNEIIKKQRKNAKRAIPYWLLSILVFVLAPYLLAIEFFSFLDTDGQQVLFYVNWLLAFILLCVGFAIRGAAKSAVKKEVGTKLIQSALDEVFENAKYYTKGDEANIFASEAVRKTDILGPYDDVGGDDYVTADYKGVHINFGDVSVTQEKTNRDGETTTVPVFKGLWAVCDFGKEFSTTLKIKERKFGKFVGGGIKTDSVSFNDQFYIDSKNPHEVFYILTPHFMEYIQAMDILAKAQIYLCFLPEGKMHIAIDSKHDFFEIGKINTDVATLRKKFVAEIRYITDLIDELRLVDTLFKK